MPMPTLTPMAIVAVFILQTGVVLRQSGFDAGVYDGS